MKLLLGLLIGTAFGFIIHRVGASQYEFILNTLRLKDLKVLKFMVLAIAVGMIGIYALDTFGLANLSIKSLYVLEVAVGGLIFGIGFALTGYCPGTAICASGEGKLDAIVTVLGGLIGALLYSLAYPILKPILIDNLSYGKVTLVDLLPLPSVVTAIIVSTALILLVYILPEKLIK